MSARRCVCELLEHAGPGDRAAQALDVSMILLITGNVTAVVLQSISEIGQAYRAWFRGFEAFSIAVFTVEYVLRVWSAIEQTYPRYKHPLWGRLRYAARPMAVIDLLAVLPFYLSFLVAIDLRVLRVLRLVRMFKLTRYSPAMNLLLTALREEAQELDSQHDPRSAQARQGDPQQRALYRPDRLEPAALHQGAGDRLACRPVQSGIRAYHLRGPGAADHRPGDVGQGQGAPGRDGGEDFR